MWKCKKNRQNAMTPTKAQRLQEKRQVRKHAGYCALRAGTLLLILAVVFMGFVQVFRFKYEEGILAGRKFYEVPQESIDIIFIGTSHMYRTYNPAILYQEYGIASYNLGGNAQPMWNSYFYIRELLKTQSPKLIVLEGFGLCYTEEYTTNAQRIRNTNWLKWSRNKIEALQASAPDKEFWDYFFEFNHYHSRYDSLQRTDFISDQDNKWYENYKGYYIQSSHQEFEMPAIVHDASRQIELSAKTETYYRMIIELCQKENIPLEIVVSPFVLSTQHQMQFNRGMEIAQEYDVPFLNYNLHYNELRFDFTQDMGDIGHTNYGGSEKVTRHYGAYLLEKYDLPDRRGRPQWDSWEQNAQMYYQAVHNIEIKQLWEWQPFCDAIIHDPNYITIVTVTGDCSSFYQEAIDALDTFGIRAISYDLKGTWVTQGGKVIEDFSQELDRKPYRNFGKFRFDFSTDGAIIANTQNYNTQQTGINIVVYDPVADVIVDSVGINGADFKRK